MDENRITYFAETDHRKSERFGIKAKDRSRHIYVIGKTGMGKTTLLGNLAFQDLQNDEGLAFIDPHGEEAEKVLDYVPEHRIKDVVYFAPHDLDNPISFNVMEDVGKDKRHLVSNGLLAAFEKIWPDVWSARMEYILGNIILALLEYPNSTLLGVNRMLSDKEYRKKVVDNINDPTVKSFWVDEYAKYTDRYAQDAGPAIQNKIGQFTSNPLIRNIVGQSHSSFDFREMMDEKKIFIANLSKGRVGEINSTLLGGMLITKMYLAGMSRADIPPEKMRNIPAFQMHVDEFQSFANKTFANILSESRKYKLNLVLAHQYIAQMPEEVRDAIFGNVGTLITFRAGSFDAEVLEKEFEPTFMAQDIVNLGFAQIYLRLMIDGVNSAPFSARTLPPLKPKYPSFKDEVVESSKKQFARPRSIVEKEILEWYQPSIPNTLRSEYNEREGPSKTSGAAKKRRKKQNIPTNRDSITSLKKEVSLELLKQKAPKSISKDKHEPSEYQRRELRRALEDAAKSINNIKKGEEIHNKSNESPVNDGGQKKEERAADDTPIKEIPENELKKMLKIEE